MENRSWKRTCVELAAKCRPTDESSYEQVKIVDIHHQGCCVKSRKKYVQGQELRIVVNTPTIGDIYMAGQAAWTGQYDEDEGFYKTGVRFLLDNPAAEEASSKLYHFYTKG